MCDQDTVKKTNKKTAELKHTQAFVMVNCRR